MSKRYMDFVPAKNADKKAAVASGAPRRTNVASGTIVTARATSSRTAATTTTKPRVVMPESTATPRTRMVRRTVTTQRTVQRMATAKPAATQRAFAVRNDAKLGEIEDLSPKFVKMDVPKRPLGDNSEHIVTQPTAKNEAKAAKSKKLIGRFRSKSAEKKAAAKSPESVEKKAVQKKDTFVAPKPAFINQDKVVKRPLSKNVYQKNIVATDEKTNKGPVAIIAKPEKESKVGLIVAIILTIILGAVAGTIAFLLLPK